MTISHDGLPDEGNMLYRVEDGIASIIINRARLRNSFTLDMVDEWADALHRAQADDSVRCIVVTGAGDRAFCAGIDLSWIEDSGTPLQHKRDLAERIHKVPLALESVDKPVLAAINGAAMGAGLDMALMCDIRLASDTAVMAESYVRVGLVPGDGGCYLLPRLVGMARALELLWTGDTIDAATAKEYGMVSHVYPPDLLMTKTYDLARRIAAAPPVAVAMMKRVAYQSARIDLRTSLDLVSSHMGIVRSTSDSRRAYAAYKSGDVPQYAGV